MYFVGEGVGPSVVLSYIDRFGTEVEIVVSELKHGVNTLTISGIKSLNWGTIGKMQELDIKVGAVGDSARSDIYFAGMTIYR